MFSFMSFFMPLAWTQFQLRVKLVEPKTIERSVGKAKRVIDRREI